MPTVIIGADLCPIEGNQAYFQRGDAVSLFHDLLPEFSAANLVVANLECPLIRQNSPIPKTGPTFGAPEDCITGIKNAGIHALCLANNHILDHGEAGLQNTLRICAASGIATVGAGSDLDAARRILIRSLGDVRIGILAVAEHEFSLATRTTWGANPLDLVDFVRNIKQHRDQFDYLIVLVHGGDEFLVPSPRIKDTCHFLVEMGANTVIVQHPHVLGGYEEYLGGHIVYGQGALLMDEAIYRDRPSFHEGFLVKLTLDPPPVTSALPESQRSFPATAHREGRGQGEVGAAIPYVPSAAPATSLTPSLPLAPRPWGRSVTAAMELIPFLQSAPVPGARRMNPEAEREFRQRISARSQAIQDVAFVEAEWLKFCQQHRRGYLHGVLGHNRYLRKLDFGGWISKLIHSRRSLLGTRNCVLCETHREALHTIFTRL